jgi:hypothetical protein
MRPPITMTQECSAEATDAMICMMIGIFLYQLNKKNEDWVLERFDIGAAFLNAELEKPMDVEWPEGIMELGFLTQNELKKYCIKLDWAIC